MDKKTWLTYILSTRDPPQSKRYIPAKSERWNKILQANGLGKKAGVVILIPDKIDFKTKFIARDKEGHYIILESSPIRGYNSYKHTFSQHRNTPIYKENLGGLQEIYRQQHTFVRGF